MKNLLKKNFICLLCISLTLMLLKDFSNLECFAQPVVSAASTDDSMSKGINVAYHTQDEIRTYVADTSEEMTLKTGTLNWTMEPGAYYIFSPTDFIDSRLEGKVYLKITNQLFATRPWNIGDLIITANMIDITKMDYYYNDFNILLLVTSVELLDLNENILDSCWLVCDYTGDVDKIYTTRDYESIGQNASVPTVTPTIAPTATPTIAPTATPTIVPTATPTIAPTATPTIVPTATPTIAPTATSTIAPAVTPIPTVEPTVVPSAEPTVEPTAAPVNTPEPTVAPTQKPTETNTPNVQDSSKNLKNGSKVIDKKTNGIYQIISTQEKTVKYVGVKAKRTKVTVPEKISIYNKKYTVVAIGKKAFKNNVKLQKIVIGAKVKRIEKEAFYGCKKLNTVVMGKNVQKICNNAFGYCKQLNYIEIPSKVTHIGDRAFYHCSNLRYILVKSTKLQLDKVGKKAFANTYRNPRVKMDKNTWRRYAGIFIARGLSPKSTFVIDPVKLIL